MAATLRPEDILTPEELAAQLKVRKSWVYEQTRSRSRNPLRRLNMGRYLQFDWTKVVEWLTEGADGHGQPKNTTRR
jgi:hypothetical protein